MGQSKDIELFTRLGENFPGEKEQLYLLEYATMLERKSASW
jgi:hypothetical protein